MTRRQHTASRACLCPECAELDLAFPGEGRQLAFPLPRPGRAQPARRRRLAEIEADAFQGQLS